MLGTTLGWKAERAARTPLAACSTLSRGSIRRSLCASACSTASASASRGGGEATSVDSWAAATAGRAARTSAIVLRRESRMGPPRFEERPKDSALARLLSGQRPGSVVEAGSVGGARQVRRALVHRAREREGLEARDRDREGHV